jgi:hypothetical protein
VKLLTIVALNKLSVSLLLAIVSITAFPQTNRCAEQLKEFLTTAPQLHQKKMFAALDSLTRETESRCGKNEYTSRLKQLLLIEQNEFKDVNFTLSDYQTVMAYVEDYRFRVLMDSVHENPEELFNAYFGFPELVSSFDHFTATLAEKMLDQSGTINFEQCDTRTTLLLAYAHRLGELNAALLNPSCPSRLAKVYQGQIKSVERKAMVDVALIFGYWTPYGNNEILGSKPSFGVLFGWGKKKMLYDIVMEFRFGSPKQEYTIQYNGSPTKTSHYFGGYIGFDFAYEIKKYERSTLYLLGGIALDGFDAVKGSKTQKGQSFFSLNLNGGLGWRVFSRDGAYAGVELRHNFNNYSNPGGTDLSGNSVTARLLVGLLKNDSRKRQLDYLERITK